jgi:hypothetical protein
MPDKIDVKRALSILWNAYSTTKEPLLEEVREAVEILDTAYPVNAPVQEAIAEAGEIAAADGEPGELDGCDLGPLVIATALSTLCAVIANEHGLGRAAARASAQ